MANTNSNLVTAYATAQTTGRSPLDALDSGCVPFIIRSKVTLPATPSAEDTLTLVPGEMIPEGAFYAPELSWIYPVTDPGAALTVDVGPSSNPDALADALTLNDVGTTSGLRNFGYSGTAPLALTSRVRHKAGEDIAATVKVSTGVVATVLEYGIAYYVIA